MLLVCDILQIANEGHHWKNRLQRWSYVKLVNSQSAGFPVHISRCEMKPGDCDDQIIQIHVTATTTWNWKNWKNWNNNILYTLETSSTNFTLDLVQISLISTLPLGQLKVCFFGAKTNKGQTNHDTIILLISSIFLFSDFFDPFPIFPRVLAASRLYSIVTCAVKLGALWGRSRQAFYSRSWYPRLYKTQLHLIKDLNTQWVYDIGLYILVC